MPSNGKSVEDVQSSTRLQFGLSSVSQPFFLQGVECKVNEHGGSRELERVQGQTGGRERRIIEPKHQGRGKWFTGTPPLTGL